MLLTPLLLALFFSYSPANSIQDPPSYYPTGPQQNVDKSVVESGGWTLCWSGVYDGNDLLSNITTACDQDYIMYAGGLTDNSNLMLLAAGKRAMVFTIQPGMSNQTILENGSYWYFNTNMGSMGFAPNSTINQSSADVYAAWGGNLDDGSLRLSWHTGHCGDGYICNGWRVGTVTGLNWGTQYTRYIYESTGGPAPTPTPSETPTPTPEPSPTQTQDPDPVQPDPDPTPVVTPTDEPVVEEQEEVQVEEEQILEPSPEPTPIEEIISEQEEVNNAIDELIVNEEEISNEQLEDITELLLENYEVNEVMPVAELLDNLSDEQVLELLEQLDENQVIEYREGVELEAGVAVVFEQLSDPAALVGELFSDPGQTLEALGQLGADMTEEEREDSQDVVVAAVVATQVATMAMTMAPPSAPSAPVPSSPQGPSGPGSQPKNEFDAGSGGEARRKPKVKVKKKIKIKKPKVKIKRNNRRIK